MTWYLDASLVVPTLVVESASEAAVAWLATVETQTLFISAWVETEVASALAMKRRMGLLNSIKMKEAVSRFESISMNEFSHTPVSTASFRDATLIVRTTTTGIRAADALHLAIAQRDGLGIATCDRVMHATALEITMTSIFIGSK